MKLSALIPDELKTISVIGMAKNAGKTVTLNRLIAEAGQNRRILGLTSIGRDGESKDIVTGTEKPGIEAVEGTLLATTDLCLKRSSARVEVIETTSENTPVGRVVIVRVRQGGNVELAGPDTNSGIRFVCERMIEHGAARVLVDGAVNRKSSASPAVTDASILSSGAVLHRDMQRVVSETAHQAKLMSLPAFELPSGHLDNSEGTGGIDTLLPMDCSVAVMDESGTINPLDLTTALNSGAEIGRVLKEGDRAVLIRGSLTSRTIKDLMAVTQMYQNVPLIVEDATRIFIDERDWLISRKMGLMVRVMRRTNLLFITINPWSPRGWRFDAREFQSAVQKAVGPVQVLNVMGRESDA
jgi:hypothetical protein